MIATNETIRRDYPELLRRNEVVAICRLRGLSSHVARQLMEGGDKAMLKRHHISGPETRGHYQREQLLTLIPEI